MKPVLPQNQLPSELQPVSSSVVFVYGSLKRGYALHHLLSTAKYLGTAHSLPLYRLFDLGRYPGLVEWPDGVEVAGELYEITAEELRILDEAEGVDEGLYARRTIHLQPPAAGETFSRVEAWFWLRPVAGCRDCGGCWP